MAERWSGGGSGGWEAPERPGGDGRARFPHTGEPGHAPGSGYAPGSRVPPGAGGARAPRPEDWELVGGLPLESWHGDPPAGRHTLASWWRRAGAAVIDAIFIGMLALLLLVPLGAGFAGGVDSDAGIVAMVAALLITLAAVALASVVYTPLMLWKTDGKTVGRLVTGIRVVRATGEPMTLGTAVMREVVLKWLVFGAAGSATGGIATLLDYLWPLWDEEQRALHDFPVNTRTVLG